MWLNRQYVFPTREAFRYHFEEPPAAPLQHEEIKRIRRIMQWDKPQYRNQRDFNPMKSERTELDYQMAPEIIRKDAPFGTESTPTITMKIIGGRQVPVIEKHATVNNDFAGSRIQPLRPIADKPNHLDPRIHGDNPGGYYHKDVQLDNLSPRPTNVVNKRPDSKDIVRGQLKALPPIQQNRTRNDLSTVFEAEPWTGDRNPPLADETEYKQNYFLGRDFEKGMENYHNSGPKEFHHVSMNEKYELSKLLRGDVLLPTDPIALSDSQKLTLSKLVCNDLNRFEPNELRDVYLECSQHDKDLRGFCPIEVLDNSLRRHKAYISDLRLIAAQYVDPNYPGKVNYERVLSFIGSVLQANAKGHLSQERQPKYYMQNGESFHTGSIYHDRQVAKLLRMVEQELSKNTYTFDWTRWQNSFFERDRDHRNTLSAAQIKDICYDHKLPLSESLLNRILELCEDNNRDGQYKWSSFMEFLGRVRPSNTGLPMPVSKRPLEYAKHFPEPVPNWPRTDTDTERRSTSPRRDISPRRGDNRPDERYTERDNYQQRDGMGYQQRDGMNSYRDGYRPGRGGGRDYDSPRNREQKIMQLSQQLHNLETQYEIARDGVSSSEKPWLDRYIKMAQALYNSDISNRGSLPRNDVIEIVNQYNNAFNLNLDMTRAHMLAIAPENLDKSGNIMLRPFLASLSSERISYKP